MGQTLTVDSRHNPMVSLCQSENFGYEIESQVPAILQNIQLEILLPEHVRYVPGTSILMSEIDISDLQKPTFKLNDLLPGSTVLISFKAESDCGLYDMIQGGMEFQNELNFSHASFSLHYQSDKYSVNPGLLVLTDVPSVSAPTNTIFSREITMSNGRLGKVSSLIFEDHHDDVRMISTDGVTLDSTVSLLRLRLDSNDFKQIGNGDAFFDLDESIIITEQIDHGKCEEEIIASEIQVYWGCDGSSCQSDTAFSDLVMTTTQGSASIRTEVQSQFPDCPCLPEGYEQCIVIENNGDAETEDLVFELNISSPTSTVLGGIEGSIKIDSGSAQIMNIEYDSVKALSCQVTGSVFGKARVTITNLKPGQKIKLCFNILPCFPSYPANGDEVEFNWSYGYEFATACKPFSFKRRRGIDVQLIQKSVDVEIEIDGIDKGDDWVSGMIYNHRWKVKGPALLDTGRLKLEICLPCGIEALDSLFISSNEELLSVETESNDTSTIIRYWYRLPFLLDSISAWVPVGINCDASCIKAIGVPQSTDFITSCDDPIKVRMEYASLICSGTLISKCPDSLECGFLSEGFASATLDCPEYDEIQTIKAYVDFDAEINRTSYGLSDDDDNRFFDGAGVDTAKLELKRSVINDTLLAEFKGEVVIDSISVSLDSLDFALISGLPFDFLRAEVKFKSSDGATEWKCDFENSSFVKKEGLGPGCCQTVVQRNGEVAIHIEVTAESLAANGCPIANFKLSHGDSVFCKIWVKNPVHTARRIGNTVVQYVSVFDRSDVPIIPFACSPIGTRLEYSGLVLNIFSYDQLRIDVCGEHEPSGGWKVYCTEISDNFFPFEFRPLIKYEHLEVFVPDQFVVDSIQLIVNYRESFVNSDTILLILPVVYNDFGFEVPDSALAMITFDEGAYYLIRPFIRLKDCSYGPASEEPKAQLKVLIKGVNEFQFGVVPIVNTAVSEVLQENEKDILIDYPEVELEIGSEVITARDRQFCKTVQLQISKAVDYMSWHAKLVKDKNAVIGLSEEDGLNITSPNVGHFISHNVSLGVYSFEICIESDNCQEDSLFLNFNWACQSDSIISKRCYDTTFIFQIKKENAEMDLDLLGSQMRVDLCDTTEWWNVEIFNGDLGVAYDLQIFFSLPNGLYILDDLNQLSYPLMSGWRSIPRPEHVGSNIYKWNLSELLGTSDAGLPGLDSLPLNRLGLRFKLLTDCALDQGSSITYWTQGTNPCGSTTNQVRKTTRPILVNGLGNSFQSFVELSEVHENCDERIEVEVSVTSNATTSGSEIIEVAFTQELEYVLGSMIAIENIDDQIPVSQIVNGRRVLIFEPHDFVLKDEVIRFTFELESWQNLTCGSNLIEAKMKSPSQAICQQTGDPCETHIINGKDEIHIEKRGVQLSIDSALIIDSLSESFVKYQLDIQIPIGFDLDTLILSVYQDQNKNDSLDIEDSLLEAIKLKLDIDSSGSHLICIPFERFGLCHWLTTLSGPCFCTSDTVSLSSPERMEFFVSDTICTGDSIFIGNALAPNAEFTWSSSEELCDTCAIQKFNATNDGDTLESHIYELVVRSDGDCESYFLYEILVRPKKMNLIDTLYICAGDTLQIVSEETGVWSGPNIVGYIGQMVNVSPENDAIYQVDFSSEARCGQSHIFYVFVHKSVTFMIVGDTLVEKGDTIQLGIWPEPDSVRWKDLGSLSCLTCLDPTFIVSTNTILCVEVWDSNGCSQLLTIRIVANQPTCDESFIFIPNVFSPNGDGINDTWTILSEFIEEIHLVVYDRWGELVFESRDQHAVWDGTYEGEFLRPDVFAYWIRAICPDGQIYEQRGNVSLMR
jgi:gliding motility-associated-like protein